MGRRSDVLERNGPRRTGGVIGPSAVAGGERIRAVEPDARGCILTASGDELEGNRGNRHRTAGRSVGGDEVIQFGQIVGEQANVLLAVGAAGAILIANRGGSGGGLGGSRGVVSDAPVHYAAI